MDVMDEALMDFWRKLNEYQVKKAVNRSKDQVDVEYLEKIKNLLYK